MQDTPITPNPAAIANGIVQAIHNGLESRNEIMSVQTQYSPAKAVLYNQEFRRRICSDIYNYLTPILARLQRQAPTPAPSVNLSEVTASLAKINAQLEKLSNIQQTTINEQQASISKQQTTLTEQQKTIQKQHESLINYDNDVLFKIKKELLMELIGIADQIQHSINEQNKARDIDKALEDFASLGEWVNSSLDVNSVRRFQHAKTNPGEYIAKQQEVVEVVPTSDPAKDGTILPYLPGYCWTMPLVGSMQTQDNDGKPKKFEFVLRPEQVVRLKYNGAVSPKPEAPAAPETDSTVLPTPPPYDPLKFTPAADSTNVFGDDE